MGAVECPPQPAAQLRRQAPWQVEVFHLAEDGPPGGRRRGPLDGGQGSQHFHQQRLLPRRHREQAPHVGSVQPAAAPHVQQQVRKQLRIDVGGAIVQQQPVDGVPGDGEGTAGQRRLQPAPQAPGGRCTLLQQFGKGVGQPQFPRPEGQQVRQLQGARSRPHVEEDGRLHAQAGQGAQHGEEECLRRGRVRPGALGQLGRPVDEAAVPQGPVQVGAGARRRPRQRWRLGRGGPQVPLHDVVEQSKQPARFSEVHCRAPGL